MVDLVEDFVCSIAIVFESGCRDFSKDIWGL